MAAGVIVVFSVIQFDRLKIDDPVGAVSVHGVCGVWGTVALGIFRADDMFNIGNIGIQLLGSAVAFVWSFSVSYGIFSLIKKAIGLRVSEEEEYQGLDYSEHTATAYPDFQITNIK
jgi:Amt family ammonium transporter